MTVAAYICGVVVLALALTIWLLWIGGAFGQR